MDGRIDLTISHFVRKEKKKKKKKVGIDVLPVPLESAFSHSMLHNTYLSHFPSTLCVNDDAQRPVALPCSPTCQILSSSFLSLSPSLSLCQSSRETTLAFGASNEIYMLSKEDAYNQHSKISLYAKLFVNETNQNNRRDATFNSRVS